MKVLFYGCVLDFTNGEKSFETGDCGTVRDLSVKLCDHFGERFRKFLFGDETCFFLVNGRGLMATGGLDTKLSPDDRIELLPIAEAG